MHLTTSYAANSALGTIYREELFFCYLVIEVKCCTAFCKYAQTTRQNCWLYSTNRHCAQIHRHGVNSQMKPVLILTVSLT